jgi:hypothetical protein
VNLLARRAGDGFVALAPIYGRIIREQALHKQACNGAPKNYRHHWMDVLTQFASNPLI